MHQVKASGENNAPLFDKADAARRAAMLGGGALSDLDKHGRAIGFTHDQVNFTTTAPGRSIIALQQPQPCLLQMQQGRVFSRVADLFGGRRLRGGRPR